jgi:aminopeptidase-like protein
MALDLRDEETRAAQGAEMHAMVRWLYPICRSITGDGVRETLKILSEIHPVSVTEVPTGTPAFDWEAPQEWVIRDAWIAGPDGRRIVDFRAHNLHVVNYSAPVRGRFTLEELRPHLFSMPDRPTLIPYRTSYYTPTWGFCLPHALLETLPDQIYDVVIDSELKDGSLTLGHIVVPGETAEEVLISTHTCHPSLANDNLSGLVVSLHLARAIAAAPRKYTYRFLYGPGTIGSILWLALNEEKTRNVRHGLVLTGMGDEGPLTYKRSRLGDKTIDRAAQHVLETSGEVVNFVDYYPYGYDERQFCSPGFDLPVGRLSRTPHGEYPEYHTSGDNPDFVKPDAMVRSFEAALAILDVLERDRIVVSTNPKGEPRLGKRGLYRQVAGQANAKPDELALLWILAYADGRHSLLDIAVRAKTPFARIDAAARVLEEHGLVIAAPGAKGDEA